MKWLLLLGMMAGFSSPVRAEEAAVSGEATEGLSAADQSRWMEAQMDYAQVVKQHGVESQEAMDAQVMLNTAARKLGVKPSGAVPVFEKTETDSSPAAPPADEDLSQ